MIKLSSVRGSLQKLALTATLAGLSVILSPFYFPVGPTKCYPFQHMINALTGVLVGPLYAILGATITGIIRNSLGVGTIFAFPGGIPGGFIVGLIYWITRRDEAALSEPMGTFIGALLSAYIVGPAVGKNMAVEAFIIAFLASSIPGSILGYIILKIIRKAVK
ncbi:MAG: energy coupling factor transporter S component ThiW [archaeon GB-1867-097]|nr:energy coupling factor transporter S component ThiW [Candidatus Culexmicrobium thermophilum]MCS7385000.1 energy coupling factor transporter S component ThiW [Candidatus Culexmicrobium thermophilum]RLE55498.1 MAG: energy coupling factor transporter S component ThiW [Candidatus Verstraetearchaeota archaeon]